jgi:3-oxoacyl-[acyl-carrier protein] reductase
MKLEAVSAVVTGAASGIGRTITVELLGAGAAVVAMDVDERGLALLRQESGGLAGELGTLVGDVADEESVGRAIDLARSNRRLNVLVNNAGVVQDGLLARPVDGSVIAMPTPQWRRVLRVNLDGAFLMARAFAVALIEADTPGGVIVNISSVVSGGNIGQSNYAASKAGLESCTRTWAQELAPHGIRVGCVAPGLISTPMLSQISVAALDEYRTRISLDRFGDPFEIWQAVRFVVECDYFTGRCIEVDGGLVF